MARFCFFDEIRNLEDDIFPLLSPLFFLISQSRGSFEIFLESISPSAVADSFSPWK